MLKDELSNQNPSIVRRNLVEANMEYGDPLPAHILNLPVLQMARQQVRNEEFGIDKGDTIWQSLGKFKRDPTLRKYIRDVGFDKAHILYWSPQQVTNTL